MNGSCDTTPKSTISPPTVGRHQIRKSGPAHRLVQCTISARRLGDEAVEVFLGAAVQVPLGEPAGKEVAGLRQAVFPASDSQVPLVEGTVGLKGTLAGDDVVVGKPADRQSVEVVPRRQPDQQPRGDGHPDSCRIAQVDDHSGSASTVAAVDVRLMVRPLHVVDRRTSVRQVE